jgi:hypothetical protein
VALIAWWTEVVVQRTGSGGGVEESTVSHKVANIVAMVRSLCELEWGKRRGWGSLGKEACKQRANKKKNERGVRYGNESENREPTSVLGKEGRTVQGGEASAAPCRGHASAAHVGPATDGVHRATSQRCSNYSRPPVANFSLSLFSFFFSFGI